VTQPDRSNWTTIVPESDAVLQSADLVGDKLVVEALTDVKGRLTIHALDGTREKTVDLPTIGSVGSVNGGPDDDSFFYGFTSFTYPTTVFRYDLDTGTSTVVREPEVEGFDADRYTVKQVFVESTDGAEVPMFIVHRKGLERDGTSPTYLYGYGGFNITITPRFSPSTLAWLEMGGIYAVPNLRGGGAYGESWHEAGMLGNKQQVFDDFYSAALHLIDENYTSRSKLAIAGASNGGLLTGASITQRPNLFGAAVVERGVLDMLRYDEFTIGWAWVPEYGSSENPEQFDFLYDYSPLHNVTPGTAYPPTMITTADTDDRVVPSHSYKFAATLQAAQAGDAPILLRVETDTGHGGGTPTSKEIEETTDVFAFLVDQLGIDTSRIPPPPTPPSRR
jgi:prolyl oligopeptidase